MNSRLWTILRKELREIFRDRRTLIGVILGPLLITPALFALIGLLAVRQARSERAKTYAVGIVARRPPPRSARRCGPRPTFACGRSGARRPRR